MINSPIIKQLNHLVEETYGMPIKYGNQCGDLAVEILKQTEQYLSFQTLRRHFGFVEKGKQNSSVRTLNILAKYCGYLHYEDFLKRKKKTNLGDINFAELIFLIPIRKESDLNFHSVCKSFAKFIYDDLNRINQYLNILVKSSVAHEFFFERFIFIDYINSATYRKVLNQYKSHKNSIEGNVLVETLTILGDYLNGKGNLEFKNGNLYLKKLSTLHPFLAARVLGTFFLVNRVNIVSLQRVIDEYVKKLSTEARDYQFPFFHYMIADYLLILKEYALALDVINAGLSLMPDRPNGWVEIGYYETFDLMRVSALVNSGKDSLARNIFNEINPAHFNFIFRKYHTIRYLATKSLLFGILSDGDMNTMNSIIDETGFKSGLF